MRRPVSLAPTGITNTDKQSTEVEQWLLMTIVQAVNR